MSVDRRFPRRTSESRLRPLYEQLEARRVLAALIESDYSQPAPGWYARVNESPTLSSDSVTLEENTEWLDRFVGPRQFERHDWVIRLSPEATRSVVNLKDISSLLRQSEIDFQVIAGLGMPGLVQVRSLSLTANAVVSSLGANTRVASFSSNDLVSGQAIPNDSDFGNMIGLNNVGQFGATIDADIDAPEAWDTTKGSPTIVVGVVDSGVDPTHPDLYLNIWLNQGEIPVAKRAALIDTDSDGLFTFYDLNTAANATQVRDVNANGYIDAIDLLDDPLWADGRDTDGNGFTDDFFGWNFRTNSNESFAPNNPSDVLGHGTHVAGTIGAIGNNARGVTGINWRSSIMALKFLDENNQGDTASAIAAVNYATMMRTQFNTNVRVLNNSWGQPGGSNIALKSTIEASGEAGILFVAAAGNGNILGQGVDNDRTPFYPASYDLDNVIGVGASDGGDRLAGFSNYGLRSVDIVAPGVGVRSTLPGGRYGEANGTSMATPHVSGTAALVWSLQPNATVAEVRKALLDQGDLVPAIGNQISTSRRLNANKSLAANVFAPTVELVTAPNITSASGAEQLLTLKYKNRLGVDKTSLGNTDVVVTRQAALDETLATTFVSATENVGKTEITAIYRLPAVGGTWDAEDYGNYVVTAKFDAARSLSGLASRETNIGSFQVKIAAAGIFYVDTFLDTVDASPGNGQAKDAQGRTSLRAAIQEANALNPQPVKIFLQTGTYPLTIAPVIDAGVVYPVPGLGSGYDAPAGLQWSNATTGDLDLQGNVSLVGLGVNRTAIDAAGIDRIMKVYPGTTVSITGLTLTGGAPSANQSGGAILNSGNLKLDLVTIKNNRAVGGPSSLGGGIAHWNGNLSLNRSTLDSNTAIGGGGLFISNLASATIDSSTISGNIASGTQYLDSDQLGGGGILTSKPGSVSINTSTFSDNFAEGAALGDSVRNITGSRDADVFPVQISGSGRYIAMSAFGALTETASTVYRNIYLYDRLTGEYELESVDSNGVHANADCIFFIFGTSVSNDGRYIVFQSTATNLVPDDNNGIQDIFVRDRVLGTTSRISVGLSGAEANEQASVVGISGDGNAIAFMSYADNLVPGDTNGTLDVFVYDIQSKTTRIASVNQNGEAAPGDNSYPTISEDGRFVSFQSDANTLVPNDRNQVYDGFVKDMLTGQVDRISVSSQGIEGNSHSSIPSISGSGRYVAYYSMATNLVAGDNNGKVDIFVFDRETRVTKLVSKAVDGTQSNADSTFPTISGNGRYVVFNSDASNLVPNDDNGLSDYFWVDTLTDQIIKIPFEGPLNTFAKATITDDGRFVSFTQDTKGHAGVGDFDASRDSFTFDVVTRTLQQDSPRQGIELFPIFDMSVSGEGNFIYYRSNPSVQSPDRLNGVQDVYVYDQSLADNFLISKGMNGAKANSTSWSPTGSDSGKLIAFMSAASNLVPGDTNSANDLFLLNRETGLVRRIATADPIDPTFEPSNPQISSDGSKVVFQSAASHLVPGDTNGVNDIFVYDVATGVTQLASRSSAGQLGNGPSINPVISGNGSVIVFASSATNLVGGDTNNLPDLFSLDLLTNQVSIVSKSVDGKLGDQAIVTSRTGVAAIDYEGRRIVFESASSNLISGDSNGASDIFLLDRQTDQLSRVSFGEFGAEATGASSVPSISSDGRYIGYRSTATNIVRRTQAAPSQYFVFDTLRQTTDLLALSAPQEFNNSSYLGFSNSIMTPRFSGASQLTAYIDRAPITFDLASHELVAYKRLPLLSRVEVSIDSSTIFSSRLPIDSTSQELIDGVMTITNSAVSVPANGRVFGASNFRNEASPLYFNTVFVNPSEIDALADNGGPTLTHRIPLNSPAFQGVKSFLSNRKDQRGMQRSGAADAGAFENVGSRIQGRIFIDSNNNKVFDADEVGVPDARIFVDFNRDGILNNNDVSDLSQQDNVSTLATNEGGMYAIENVQPGYVSIVASKNGLLSQPVRGQDNLPTKRGVQSMAVSQDGRYVAFVSDEPNLVSNDTNGVSDVFVFDRVQGEIKRVSVSSSDAQANGPSTFAAISDDGAAIAFQSKATNLVGNDTNGSDDVFVHYLATGITRRVSEDQNGVQGNGDTFSQIAMDPFGQQIAFASRSSNLAGDNNGVADLFIKNLSSGVLSRVAQIDKPTRIDSMSGLEVLNASFSDDFQYITFVSGASGLVANDTNGFVDVFLLNRQNGAVSRLNVGPNGEQANNDSDQPVLSGDGRFVAFTSRANNLYANDRGGDSDLFIFDRQLGTSTHLVTPKILGAPSLTRDGKILGMRVNTGTLDQYRIIDLTTSQYTSVVSSIPANSSFSSVLAKQGTGVLISLNSNTYVWENSVSQGPVVRLTDATSLTLDLPVSVPLGSVSGRVYMDSISNGQVDVGEQFVSGVTVYIDANNNAQLDVGEISRVTDSVGVFTIPNLAPERTYRVAVVPPAGLFQVAPQSPFSWPVYLPSGVSITDRDFGFVPSSTGGQFENATLSGKLFNDLNADGLIQNGEAPLVGVTVYLDLNGNEVRDFNEPRTISDAAGNYTFTGLGNRPYTVRTLLETGTVQTSPLGTKFATNPYALSSGSTQLANPQDVIVDDLNADGWSDLAVALFSGNSVSIRLNDKAGGFGGAPITVSVAPEGVGPIALASGKLNNGTAVDMISANQLNGTATVLLDFNGAGFNSKQTLAVGDTPTDIALGRFDSDTDIDAIVANQSTDQLTLLVNNGAGVFAKGASFSSGGKKPTALATGFFNNDAFLDIAVANYGTHPTGGDFGNVAVLLGRGDGTFQAAVSYSVGFGPISIAADDFNGDGFVDLVTANFLANTASLLLGSSSGVFTVANEQLATGQGPLQVQLQDIEGDGDKDILVTNLLSQTISVLRNRKNQGGSGFEPAENFGVAEFSTAPRLAFAAGDFDKSGTADIAIINSLSDSLTIMRNTLVNGAHRIQLTGVENVTNLNFGTRPDVLLPRLDPIDNPESLVEDAPQQTVTLNGIALGRAGGPALRITAISGNNAVIPNPVIEYIAGATTGTLRFTPVKDASGQVAITVTARDAGADKQLDTADDAVLSRVFTVSIKPVNDAPTFDFPASRSLTAPEDSAARTVNGFITNISSGGGAYEASQTLSAFVVLADNLALFNAQPLLDASGTLRFTPAANAVGTATITVTLSDNGDTAFGGTNRKIDQFVLTITPVNDAPSINIGGKQTILVGANGQSVNNFATGFTPGGGADENSQTIAGFVVSVDKPELFSVLPTIDLAGTLRYTPSATRTGVAKVSVQVRDDGGSNSGGIDLSTLKQFDIEVAPLPDTIAPTPIISSTTSSITNAASFDLAIEFGEVVTGFALSDLVLTNATASNLIDLGAGKFSLLINPTADGALTVSIPAAAVKDLANNNNVASTTFGRTIDRVAPVATITTSESNPTNRLSFPIEFNFGEPVLGFDLADLVLGNCTVSGLTETTLGRYTAVLTATTDGVVLVGFSAGVARDAAGNGNTAPTPLVVSINTGSSTYKPLLATVEPSPTGNRSFVATIDFGRVVTGFEVPDLELANATTTIANLGGGRYQLNVTATNEGNVVIRLPADKVRDINNRANDASDSLTVRFVDTANSDFGDAPNAVQSGFAASYPTLLRDNGAFHKRSALVLGTTSDAESDGLPSLSANGDDASGLDDEDGIAFPISNVIGTSASTTSSFVAFASSTGFLDAWMDFNRDGDWNDVGEQIATKAAVIAGTNWLPFTIPVGALAGTTYGRFRLSTAGGLAPTGSAIDGEVEDHAITLIGGGSKAISVNASELGGHSIAITNGSLVITAGSKVVWSASATEVSKLTAVDGLGIRLYDVSVPVTNLPGTIRYAGSGKPIELAVDRTSIDLSLLTADKLVGIETVDLTASGSNSLAFTPTDVGLLNSTKSLRVIMDVTDKLATPNIWKAQPGRTESGVWVQPYTNGGKTLEVIAANAWQNKVNPLDVDGDQQASPLDVLMLINTINGGQRGTLPSRGTVGLTGFLDTDGDNTLGPLDVLAVINQLNQPKGSGEGESAPSGFAVQTHSIDRLMGMDLDEILEAGTNINRQTRSRWRVRN